jgi:DNA-binding GntR family transcriptional regulator/predicted GIY-YIG superfamily endonuclease
MPETSERTALYRFYDATKRLLYVGISSDLKKRWAQHEESKAWWPQVASETVEWLESRAAALVAERNAIRAENPLFNHQNKQSPILSQIAPQRLNEVPNGTWRPYEFMAHELRGFVHSGSLRPGDRFPTVRELMDVYGISTATVQRGLAVLKKEGFAVGRAGFGVCAALPVGFRREVASNETPEGVIEQLANHRTTPSPRNCDVLEVPHGTFLGGKSWVRRVDGRAVEVVHSYRHPDATPDDQIHVTTDLLTADAPRLEEVKILGLAPLLMIRRVTRTSSGRPIDFYQIVKNAHLTTMTYEFKLPGNSD